MISIKIIQFIFELKSVLKRKPFRNFKLQKGFQYLLL